MGLKIVEFFGYDPADSSIQAKAVRENLICPYLDKRCQKTLNDGTISGVCTMRQSKSAESIVTCPIRLYDDDYGVLRSVAKAAFAGDYPFVKPDRVSETAIPTRAVVAFGKGSGKEIKLPFAAGRGGFFVDWVLALLGPDKELLEFVAVEVQSIDTTGNYRAERDAYLRGTKPEAASPGGINWENVSKRILPQLIYKGHVLRRERLCRGGLFFVCPTPVFERINARLGAQLLAYENLQPGTITFQWYSVGAAVPMGERRRLVLAGQFTTTVDQIAVAFTAPVNLPPANVYEAALREAIKR